MEKINCSECGKEHDETTGGCCWVDCECDSEICGRCGSVNIGKLDMGEDDDEAQYWCCNICNDCGLSGCGECI